MDNGKKGMFDDALKEILRPEDGSPETESHLSAEESGALADDSPQMPHSAHSGPGQRVVSRGVEITVRIFAALIALVLLILFAVNISSR